MTPSVLWQLVVLSRKGLVHDFISAIIKHLLVATVADMDYNYNLTRNVVLTAPT